MGHILLFVVPMIWESRCHLCFWRHQRCLAKSATRRFQYDDWTDEDLCLFRPGLAFLCAKLKRSCPTAKIYFMVDMQLGQEIVDSFHTIIAHYQVNYIDLYGIDKDWDHPTVFGMKSIADQTIAAIRK